MATLRDIRRRIDSVGNTMQITNAMKMVSTAKLNRAQEAVRSAQPYAEVLREMVIAISEGMTGDDHPLFAAPEGGKTVVVLFTSDRGLCGAFNANLNKHLLRELAENHAMQDAELVVFGRQGQDFFRRRGATLRKTFVNMTETEKVGQIREMVATLRDEFLAGEVGRLFLAFNLFSSAISQYPRVMQLLPISPPEGGERTEPADTRETLFEPSRGAVLDDLLPKYLENQIFQAHLNTEAGEHGARMVAMDGATRNAGEMISRLTLEMNKARQAAITKELIEIVNGAQAL